jgi:hypothetical protein
VEAARQSWSDDRLDDLNRRVENMASRMDAGFVRVDTDLRELNARFEALQRTLIQVAFALGGAVVTLVAALLGLIAVQS